MIRWREAMATALYGPDGFFVRPGPGPAAHFRTSVNASPRFAEALLALLERLDRALRHPDRLTVVDVGAGRGELLTRLAAAAPAKLANRLELVAVEVVPPSIGSPGESRSGRVAGPVWSRTIPSAITGLLIGSEWLDNVPVEVAELDPDRVARYVLVDPETGAEALGEPVTGADATWLETWWPLREPGARAEIGLPRDRAWAEAVACLAQGAALAIDYGHLLADRPPLGTLTGYRDGREVTPVPDGSCDLTAHVAIDAVSRAGSFALHTNTHVAGERDTAEGRDTRRRTDTAEPRDTGWRTDTASGIPHAGSFALHTNTHVAATVGDVTVGDANPGEANPGEAAAGDAAVGDQPGRVYVCRAKGGAYPTLPGQEGGRAEQKGGRAEQEGGRAEQEPDREGGAGQHRAGGVLVRQAAALRALGITGARPPLELASTDPAGYLHRLSRAGAAAELTDPAGLGGHYWLFQPVGMEVDVARWLT